MSMPTPANEPTALPDAEGQESAKPFMRTIKSFVKRAGRTTTGQAKAFEELGPKLWFPTNRALSLLKRSTQIPRALPTQMMPNY